MKPSDKNIIDRRHLIASIANHTAQRFQEQVLLTVELIGKSNQELVKSINEIIDKTINVKDPEELSSSEQLIRLFKPGKNTIEIKSKKEEPIDFDISENFEITLSIRELTTNIIEDIKRKSEELRKLLCIETITISKFFIYDECSVKTLSNLPNIFSMIYITDCGQLESFVGSPKGISTIIIEGHNLNNIDGINSQKLSVMGNFTELNMSNNTTISELELSEVDSTNIFSKLPSKLEELTILGCDLDISSSFSQIPSSVHTIGIWLCNDVHTLSYIPQSVKNIKITEEFLYQIDDESQRDPRIQIIEF